MSITTQKSSGACNKLSATLPREPGFFLPFSETLACRFDLEDPKQELALPVASAILVRAPGEDGKPVVRPYTPLAGDDKGHFDLLVKYYDQGKMSKYIHNLKPGQTLDVKGPLPKIAYAPNKWKSIGMIAGGTGRTLSPPILVFLALGSHFPSIFSHPDVASGPPNLEEP